MPTDPPSDVPDPPEPSAGPILELGTTGPLEPALLEALARAGIAARVIAEHVDPPQDIDVVLVVKPPSPLIGRCRGRWPIVAVVDDPRATDVLRLLRGGVTDVTRRPIQAADLVSRIRRALDRRDDPKT